MFSIVWPGQLSYSYQSCFSKREAEPKRGDMTCWRWHAQSVVDRRSELLSSDSSTCAHCAGTLPLKTWLHNTCMKVAGCHTLFMEVHAMVLVIWTYLCMKVKKILFPVCEVAVLLRGARHQLANGFPSLQNSLCVCGLGLDLILGTLTPFKSSVGTFSQGVCR